MEAHGGLSENSKTIYSVDFTTDCPKRRAGNPCKYCYVEAARRVGFNAKQVVDHMPYDGFALRLRKSTIQALNKIGGLRLFSSGDYMEEHAADVQAFLDDCVKVGLKVKAITKQPAFVDRFHDHPAVAVIHLSVDTLGSGVPHKVAKAYRRKFAKVAVRCAIMSDADLAFFRAQDWIDILTLNHGMNGFRRYVGKDREALAKLDPRACCKTGKCTGCSVKCRKAS